MGIQAFFPQSGVYEARVQSRIWGAGLVGLVQLSTVFRRGSETGKIMTLIGSAQGGFLKGVRTER